MSGIQKEWALNPVTALDFYHSKDGKLLIFAGEGLHLKIYEADSGKPKLLTVCSVFESQTIHGISIQPQLQSSNSSSIVIWGGKSYVLLDSNDVEDIVSLKVNSIVSLELRTVDWILDGSISPYSETLSCIFITARSAAIHVRCGNHVQSPVVKHLSSPSQSILYSAHIAWTSAEQIMIAAGTVFGEIEIITWDHINAKNSIGQLVFTLTGHEGSIFGVQISPEIFGPDRRPRRLLATCSDDRTIRVWDLSSGPANRSRAITSPRLQKTARETGFGENNVISKTEHLSRGRCLAVVMGHASRIWRVRFLISALSSLFPTRVDVLSFGEDSTCQQWSFNFCIEAESEPKLLEQVSILSSDSTSLPKYPGILNHLDTFAYNSGKHLWSAAIISCMDDGNYLATGGADGKISMYSVNVSRNGEGQPSRINKDTERAFGNPRQRYSKHTDKQSWTLGDIERSLPSEEAVSKTAGQLPDDKSSLPNQKQKPVKTSKDSLNRYCFVDKNKILITTSCGRILLGKIGNLQSWKEIHLPDIPGSNQNDLKSYSLLLRLPDCSAVLLAGSNGLVYIYRQGNQIHLLRKFKGKVTALLDVSPPNSTLKHILVNIFGTADAHIILFDPKLELDEEVKPSIIVRLPENFFVTCARNINGQLVLGSRNGVLAVYDVVVDLQNLATFVEAKIQGNDAITSIIPVPLSNMEAGFHFLITSRTGSYSIFFLSHHSPKKNMARSSPQLVHQAAPPLGPMIEYAWFEESSLLLYGFRSKNFVVWNDTKQQEITSVNCGGAHRSYTYLPVLGGEGAGSFAYTKASKLCLHRQDKPSHIVVKSGGHGREIKAGAASRSEAGLIATGAEDTTIRIWHEREAKGTIQANYFECCAVIEKHTAGIQHLEWFCVKDTNVEYLCSAAGNEEFYIWRITFLPGFGLGIVCEASLTDYSAEHDLRIMSVDVRAIKNEEWLNREAMNPTSEVAFRISFAYSDSTIRQYNYTQRTGFKKISQSRYTSACLTQIINPFGDNNLLSAATDGSIALWKGPNPNVNDLQELNLISRTKIHQSAILSLDIRQLGTNELVIATGGDDNSLALTYFQQWEVRKRFLVPSAHAAAITGVGFMRICGPGGLLGLWTVGGDQRLKRWTIDVRSDGEEVKIWEPEVNDDVWCSIPDAAGLATLTTREEGFERCLVWGNGMEVAKAKVSG